MNILITGATGLVGRAIMTRLRHDGHLLSGTCREPRPRSDSLPLLATGEIGPKTIWSQALAGADVVVHLAARVHVMGERTRDALVAARRVNLEGSSALAKQAAAAGVKRLIFTSTLKVHGETSATKPFVETDAPAPTDAYAISKWEAEQELSEIAAHTGLELIILRPPLVYGPGVKANFLALLDACAKERRLPLGRIDNRRSLIYAGNLADIVAKCIDAPAAAGETFLVRDDGDLSTPELVRQLSQALGTQARLLDVPVGLLYAGGRAMGRRAMIDRLAGSLTVDDTKVRKILNWRPPWSTDHGFAKTAAWYLHRPPSPC